MPEFLDLDSWPRRRHYEIFRSYEDPFFGLTAHLNATALRDLVKSVPGTSFSAACYYLSLLAANEIEPFRYRLRGDSVVVHSVLHGGATVPLPDRRFTFSYFDFDRHYLAFQANVRSARTAAQAPDHDIDPNFGRDDLVYHTVIPWVTFTHIKHPRRGGKDDSVPLVAFGRCVFDGGRWVLPMSVQAHHALMDGVHMGEFFERIETWLASPDPVLGLLG